MICPVPSRSGTLVVEHQVTRPLRKFSPLELADEGHAGVEHLLLVVVGLLGVLRRKEIEVGLTENLGIVGDLLKVAQGLVDEKEAALPVFE